MPEQASTITQRPFPAGDRVLRFAEIRNKVGISRTHVYELVASNRFPAPLKLIPGGRASGWLESEIDAWIAQRVAERDASLVAQSK